MPARIYRRDGKRFLVLTKFAGRKKQLPVLEVEIDANDSTIAHKQIADAIDAERARLDYRGS